MTDLTDWLAKLGLERYAQVLAENDVDLEVLPHLTDDDLRELGLSLGHRRRLMAAVGGQLPAAQGGAGPVPEAGAGAGPDSAERRQLTVMFCDMVGSTELAQTLDPEAMREVLRRYHDTVTGAVARHEGHVAKLLGDGVLAYFGWPSAHEDDAERAIRAALEAVAAVSQIEADGGPLRARAGIATGSVVIGDMRGETAEERGSIAGATPNLAARLQGAARPGEVVIHDATRRLVRATFDLEALGAQALKGFAEPVEVWRVAGISHVGSRFDALRAGGLTALVGRGSEIGLVHDRWRLAREGEGQVVVISGEAGIGKSRILREFADGLGGDGRGTRAADGVTVLRYQCSPHEVNAAFQPIIAEIETTAGFASEDSAETRLDRLERHLEAVFPDAAEDGTAAIFAALLGLPEDRYPRIEMTPQRRKQRLVTLLAERIAGLAQSAPVILLVEDIHWVDASTLEALDGIVGRIGRLPVLAVMTCRPEFEIRWGGQGHVSVQSLTRLGRTDGRAIAERVAGGRALPDALLERIIAQTDGIPLFIEELTKTVLESGLLERQGDRYVLRGPLPALAIPTTLQDSLMARLDRLSPVKNVVQAAACIGREFDAGLLGAALAMEEARLDAALTKLCEAELIFPLQGGGEPGRRYVFKHALVQDAAYASLLTSARRRLHESLAQALERTDGPDPLELARHLAGAGLNQRAAGLYLAAGQRALAASALPEAIGALELGLQAVAGLDASDDRDRIELDLRIALGTARMANFGWAHPSVAEAMEPAFPLARAFGTEDALGSILWALWVHYQTRTEFARAHEWLSQLKTTAEARPETDLPLVYDMSAGCQDFWEADYRAALQHTDRLRGVYDRERHSRITGMTNHDPLVFSQHWAGSLADWIAGRPDGALERLDEALDLARRIGHPFNLVFALTAGATALVYLGQPDRLLALCDEAAKVAADEALGPFSERVNVMQWRGGALVVRGDYRRGTALAQQGNDFWTASGGRICTAMFRGWIVLGLCGLGRIGEAAELNAGNIAHCRQTGDRYMEPECVRLRGELVLAAETPDVARAEADFREALGLAEDHGARSWALRSAMSLARLLRAQDRRGEATACLEPVYESFREGLDSQDLKEAAALLASLG